MNRADILDNKFEFIAYKNYRDADNMNRFINDNIYDFIFIGEM